MFNIKAMMFDYGWIWIIIIDWEQQRKLYVLNLT